MKNIITLIFLMACSFDLWSAPARFRNEELFSTQTAADLITGTSTIFQRSFAIYCSWTEDIASLAGTISLDASTDSTNWTQISGTLVTISGASSTLYNVTNVHAHYIRENITISGGTGTFTCSLNSKPE